MNKSKLSCMGDSLTEGYGISVEARWSNLLAEELNLEVRNQGISGDTTSGMLARFQHDVIAEAPTHVIITGGTNDLSWNLSDELILSNYSAMLRQANRAGIQVLIGIPTPVFHQGFEEDTFELYLDLQLLSKRVIELKRKLMLFSERKELAVIDFFQNLKPKHFLYDGIHPNEEGNMIMKETAKTVLEEILV